MNDNFFMILMKYCVHWTIIRETRFFLSNMPPCFKNRSQKGLDLLLKKDIPSKSMLFRYLILLYIKKAIPGAYLPPGPSRSSLDLDE